MLFRIIVLLALLSLFLDIFDSLAPNFPGGGWLHHAFDLDEEANIPTFFSTGLLLLAGSLSLLIARAGARPGPTPSRAGSWRLLGVILILMGGDELLMFHETLGSFLDKPFQTAGVYAWVIPGTLAVLWFVWSFSRFFRSLPGIVRRYLILSFILFVGGAVGLEYVEAVNRKVQGELGLSGLLLTNSQETLEMLGVAVLLKGLLIYIRDFLEYPKTQFALLFGD
ncbi:hypothetical protein [Deinococcus planocerae]|uniref:hypothetical protein n=1 Tax=Deinococcus planocerae TaxID=1737569 RepID=UPI0011AF287F|nr:hypothetical protein [Deinococcus planocerae]